MRPTFLVVLAVAAVMVLVSYFSGRDTPPPAALQRAVVDTESDSLRSTATNDSAPGPDAGDVVASEELTEQDEQRALTNDEALRLRDERFGSYRDFGDPYNYVPIRKPEPRYPPEAALLGLSGFVLMEYSVTSDGVVDHIAILDASSPLFELEASRSVGQYRYAPRIDRGAFVDSQGLKTLIVYGDPEGVPTVDEGTDKLVVSPPD